VQEITIEFNSFAFDERFKQSEMAKRLKELLPEDPQELLGLSDEELASRFEEVTRLSGQWRASEEQVQERRQQLIAIGINKENWLDRQ
jgi:predicted house-cleaning noncanonical NTP pyrophosphatase (MazG superfamily)